MADLFLPPGVRYTCIRCGECCRSLEVTLTEAEHERLTTRDWSAELPGVRPERAFARIRRPRGKQVWRIRPAASGACPFLTSGNLCLVHAKLGYGGKPFAGRLFPFTFTVTPIGVFVGVRFNCPAVVRGEGRDLADQRRDIAALFDEYARVYDPPREPERVRFFGRYELDWHDIVRLEDQLFAFLLHRDLDVAQRLLACHRLVRRLASGAFQSRQGGQVGIDPDEILAEVRRGGAKPGELGAMERVMTRLLAATFAGASLPSVRELSLLRRTGTRLANVRQRLLMALGSGRVALRGLPGPVPIREVSRFDRGSLDTASAAMLERYFVAKVAGQAFFGRSFFRRAFAVGLDFLVTTYGPILWLASAHAIAGGSRRLAAADIEYGIRQVDYGLNYLPTLGGITERMRGALFWHWDTAEKILSGQ